MWGKKIKNQPTYYNSTPQLVKKDFCCVRIKFIWSPKGSVVFYCGSSRKIFGLIFGTSFNGTKSWYYCSHSGINGFLFQCSVSTQRELGTSCDGCGLCTCLKRQTGFYQCRMLQSICPKSGWVIAFSFPSKFIESKKSREWPYLDKRRESESPFPKPSVFPINNFPFFFLRNLSRSCCSRSNWRQKAALRHLGQHGKCCKQDGKYWKSWLYAGLYCFLVERCKR